MKSGSTPPAGLHAILFADISGSTSLYEAIGDSAARRIVVRVFDILSKAVDQHEGKIVKTIGDEMMCLFTDGEAAVRTSQEMQRQLQAAGTLESDLRALRIRIGIHTGEVMHERDDVFGDAVNTAARVVGQAKGGQILTTQETLDLLPDEFRETSRFVDHVAVKGKREHLDLYEVVWETVGLTSVEGSFGGKREASTTRLMIRFRQQQVVLGEDKRTLQLGRGSDNDFVLEDSQVSRLHARIEFRRNKFILVDQSINGTYVLIYGEREERVRRDEFVLRGAGIISAGRVVGNGTEEHIHFSCE